MIILKALQELKISPTQDVSLDLPFHERKLLKTLRWQEGSEFNNFKISHTWQRYCSHYKLSASKYEPWCWPMHKFLTDCALEVSVMPQHVLRCFSISRIGGVTLDSIECVCSVAQACTILCYPLDHSLPGSSVNGIFWSRILEWVAISFSRGSSQPRDQTLSPAFPAFEGRFFE